jgi:hypothetical protein
MALPVAHPLQLALGVSEFRHLREDALVYIDKSWLIRDVLADAANVLLLPRPRRFGKTTNLSMLRTIYESLFLAWTDEGLGGDQKRHELVRALLGGDVETCERLLEHWLLASASLHDTARFAPPERFYHGFVLGLLVSLGERYDVVSNQESGYGRCDVLITPRVAGQPGVALELKVRDERRGETVEQALERALEQLAARDHAASLRTRGASPVHEVAVVFDGKRVFARARG